MRLIRLIHSFKRSHQTIVLSTRMRYFIELTAFYYTYTHFASLPLNHVPTKRMSWDISRESRIVSLTKRPKHAVHLCNTYNSYQGNTILISRPAIRSDFSLDDLLNVFRTIVLLG